MPKPKQPQKPAEKTSNKPVTVHKSLDVQPLKEGHPLYDEKKRRDLDARVERIKALKGKSDVLKWQEGWEFVCVRDQKLFLQDGYSGMSKWIVGHLGRSRSRVAEKMRFAESFSLSDVREHGAEKLELGRDYVVLTPARDEAWTPDSLVVTVPRDQKIVEVPFAKASFEELQAAIDHQQGLHGDRGRAAVDEAAQEVIAVLERALTVPELSRPLANIAAKAAKTGLAEDTLLTVNVRLGDLRSVVERIAQALLAPPKSKRKQRG